MIYLLWELLLDICENSFFVILAFGFLSKKDKYKTQTVIICSIAFMTCVEMVINALQASTIISVPAGLFLRLLIVTIFFSANWTGSIFICVMYTLLAMLAEGIAVTPTYIYNINFEELLTIGSTRIAFSFLYILILSVFVCVIISFKNKVFVLSTFERIAFFTISLISTMIEQLLLIVFSKLSPDDKLYSMTLFVFFLVMILYWGMSFYIYRLGVTRNQNIELEKEKITSLLEKSQYELVMSSASELRGLRHDFKHHLSAVQSFIDNKEYDGAEKYIKAITETIDQTHFLISSGNTAIDSIISHSLYIAQVNDIYVKHSVYLPANLTISNPDICSILSNILDNAIEACSNLPANKNIELTIKPFNDMLLIIVSNTCTGVYKKDKNGNFLTTKESIESGLHGIGLNRVKKLVLKNNGIMDIEPLDSSFTVKILLPQ